MITVVCLILASILSFVSDAKGFKYGIKTKNLIRETLIIDAVLLLFFAMEGACKQ